MLRLQSAHAVSTSRPGESLPCHRGSPMLATLSATVLLATCLAADPAPPAAASPAVLKLIEQLGSEDYDTRKAAENTLTEMGEGVVDALRAAGKSHADVDVRLRALVIAAAIEKGLATEVRRFEGHADGIIVLALSPDGKRLASASSQSGSEHVARIWDLATGKEVFQLKGHTGSIL